VERKYASTDLLYGVSDEIINVRQTWRKDLLMSCIVRSIIMQCKRWHGVACGLT